MKSFIGSIILLSCLIAASTLHSYYLNQITNELISKNNTVLELVQDENYSLALSELNSLDEYIDTKRTVLSATMDHSVLNKIDEYVSQAQGFISEEEKADSLVSCQNLATFLENMPKNYKILIENIL